MENFGLYRVSGRCPFEECDDCHDIGPGHWYEDDDSGGSEWFLCDKCAKSTRAKRKAREEATA